MKKNLICLFSFLSVLSFLLVSLVLYRVAPFGDSTLIIYDCAHQIYPFMCVLHDKLRSGESIFYYWNSGLGGNFLSIYFNYLASPTNLLVVLFDKSQILNFITFSIIIKIALSAGTFSYYFYKTKKIQFTVLIIPIAFAYALSGYILSYLHAAGKR